MADVADLMWGYLINLDLSNFFLFFLNFYLPYGMMFWLLGLTLFIIIHLKTKTLLYSLMAATLYFSILSAIPGVVMNAYSLMAMRYVGLGLIFILGYYLYTIFKGRV